MKSVLFALDGVLRDAQGEPIKDNIALARALYCAGHDVLVTGPRDAYEWLHKHDVTFDDLLAGRHIKIDATKLMFAVSMIKQWRTRSNAQVCTPGDMKMRKLLFCLMLCGTANAAVTAETNESQVANLLFNGCSAQRAQMGVQETIKQANPGGNPAVTDLIIKGYKFGIDYPTVGCNQFFTVVIDQLVNARSKA